MKFGLPISVILHALAAFGGLWMWATLPPQFADTQIIPVNLITVSDITNIKATRAKIKKPEAEVTDPISEPEPEPVLKTETEPKPAPEKQPKQVFSLDALEKAFGDVRKDNPDADKQKALSNENKMAQIADISQLGFGDKTGSAMAAVDYIRSRLHDCWFVDAGAVDFQNLIINVEVILGRDAEVLKISVLNDKQITSSPNRSWAVARLNALTALRKCAPYDGLLTIDYDVWKQLRLHLNPGEYE